MPAPRPSASRLLEVHDDAWEHVLAALRQLADSDVAAPTPVGDWQVADLVAHFELVAAAVESLVASTEPPSSMASYLAAYAGNASDIDARTRAARSPSLPAAVATVDLRRQRAEDVLAALATSGTSVVAARRGPIRTDDFVITRVIELALHADDLLRAVPRVQADRTRPAGRAATQLAVRGLAEVLAERVPGHSVEVRVPPFAAVQCVPGPRHTRGTPPAVVELEPVTWLRLAGGRLTWAAALRAGQVRASGQRTDLSPHLPLLA